MFRMNKKVKLHYRVRKNCVSGCVRPLNLQDSPSKNIPVDKVRTIILIGYSLKMGNRVTGCKKKKIYLDHQVDKLRPG